MKLFNQYLQKYLMIAFPFVMAIVAWDYIRPIPHSVAPEGSFLLKWLWEIGSWNLILWFFSLVVFMVLLVFWKDTREQSIKFLAGIQERDERENMITGNAARNSFVATTGLLIGLLFISCFTLTLAKNPDQSLNKHGSTLSIGFHFSPENRVETNTENGIVYTHQDLPLSKSAVILLVLICQVGIFRLNVRKDLGAV